MCEGPPELRGVKRSLMSTNEWFVIRCLKFLECSQRKPQLNRNSIFLRLTAELAGKYALIVIFVCLCVGM